MYLFNNIAVDLNKIPLIGYKLMILTIALLIASVQDYKTLKISNKLTYSLLLSPIVLMAIGGSIEKSQVLGLVIGFTIVFGTAFIQGSPMGGDIKLVSGIGFLVGVELMLQILLFTLIISIPIALIHRLAIKSKKPLPFAVLLFIGEIIIVLLNI